MSTFSKIKRSTGRFLRQVFRKPKAKISRGSVLLVAAMIIIFFTALTIRVYPLIDAQPIVRAFDPWFQLKVTNYITENGFGSFFTWYDTETWVPFGRDMTTTSYIGVPFTTATFYFILNGLGIPVDVLMVALLLPAFMGALTVVVGFFLGRELSNNTVGLFTSLFLAFIPAFLQRTIAGFYDNECIGVFAITLTLYFFTRSLKRGSVPSAVLAGVSLGYLQASWGAADFVTGLLAMYAFFMLVSGKYSPRLLTSYLPTVALGIFLGGLVPRNGFSNLTSFSILAPIGVGVLLAGYEVWTRIRNYREATASMLAPHMKPILMGIFAPIAGVVAYWVYASGSELSINTVNTNPILTIGGKFLTVINPFYRLDQRIFASVAEHLPSPWGSFYNTLLVLIFFFPLGMYFLFRRGRDEDYLMVLYGVTAVYFTGSMIRLGLVLAPIVAILSAVAVYNILSPYAKIVTQQSIFERRRFRMSSSLTSEHAIAAYAFVGLLLSVNIFLGVSFISGVSNPEFARSNISSNEQLTDWQTSMTYVRNVLPDDAVIASWWDYGYWINSAGGGKTVVDNATWNSTQIALMGYALMSLNLTESLKTLKQWNTTHVLVYWGHRIANLGGDDGKWPWMVRIAEDHLGSNAIDDETYLGDNDETQEAFFSSTIYKLMVYGESRSQEEAQQMGLSNEEAQIDRQFWQDSQWTSHMPVDLHGAFSEAFFSSKWGTVKIYEVDYTMYEQYLNKTSADWPGQRNSLGSINLDGTLSSAETSFTSYDTVFGGGYEAEVHTRSNGTHLYYGVSMDNYTLGEDAFGLQIAPVDSEAGSDVRIVNYQGNEYYDGYVDYNGDWAQDTGGANSTDFATGENVIEFLIPLDSEDSQDLSLSNGMNYRIKFMFWNNIDTGEPTFSADWTTIWVPVELH